MILTRLITIKLLAHLRFSPWGINWHQSRPHSDLIKMLSADGNSHCLTCTVRQENINWEHVGPIECILNRPSSILANEQIGNEFAWCLRVQSNGLDRALSRINTILPLKTRLSTDDHWQAVDSPGVVKWLTQLTLYEARDSHSCQITLLHIIRANGNNFNTFRIFLRIARWVRCVIDRMENMILILYMKVPWWRKISR